jgi:hypothetical protein
MKFRIFFLFLQESMFNLLHRTLHPFHKSEPISYVFFWGGEGVIMKLPVKKRVKHTEYSIPIGYIYVQ